jgi:hypothetical protein
MACLDAHLYEIVYYAVNNQNLFYRLNCLHLIGRALLNPQQLRQKIKIGYIRLYPSTVISNGTAAAAQLQPWLIPNFINDSTQCALKAGFINSSAPAAVAVDATARR